MKFKFSQRLALSTFFLLLLLTLAAVNCQAPGDLSAKLVRTSTNHGLSLGNRGSDVWHSAHVQRQPSFKKLILLKKEETNKEKSG